MGRFLKRLGGFLLIQVLIASAVLVMGAPRNSNHYLGTMQDKVNRLAACEGPRIVVLGGSNVAFGIRSDTLQQQTDMPTVNLGLHVSLGLPFLMECYRQHSHPGDVVVLSPEYHLLADATQLDGDDKLIDEMVAQWPDATQYIPGRMEPTWKEFLDHEGLWVAHQWVGRAFRKLRNKDTTGKIYYRSSFNERCDLTAHHGQTRDELQPINPVPMPTSESANKTVQLLNDFAEECQRNNVTVYLSYPPFMKTLYDESEESIQAIHALVTEQVRIPCLNEPQRFALDRPEFFDTGYHLAAEAGEQRSRFIGMAIARGNAAKANVQLANKERDKGESTNNVRHR